MILYQFSRRFDKRKSTDTGLVAVREAGTRVCLINLWAGPIGMGFHIAFRCSDEPKSLHVKPTLPLLLSQRLTFHGKLNGPATPCAPSGNFDLVFKQGGRWWGGSDLLSCHSETGNEVTLARLVLVSA
ncbi:hypothetical protein HMPREF9374_0034 [Desmospora sp. 8437]|nr:hypothetical protein HMPREF9374_0034 [Desmospora sp. 8437]